MAQSRPDLLAALDQLGTRLELAAATTADPGELAALARDLDLAAQNVAQDDLTEADRHTVERVGAQVARAVALVEERQARETAAHSRDRRLRVAYGAGR